MAAQVVRISEPTPGLEMHIRRLLERTGTTRRWADGGALFAVLGAGGEPLGVALAGEGERDSVIHLVAARPGGVGTGSALVNHLLQFLAGRCDRVFVVAGPAAPFFERFGFSPVAVGDLPAELQEITAVRDELAAGCVPLVRELARRWQPD